MATIKATYIPSVTVDADSADPNALNANTIRTNVLASQTQIQAWIAANPSGAVLTAAQTLVLAKMLNGLCKLLLQELSDTTGT
jgi:hypothetical protein